MTTTPPPNTLEPFRLGKYGFYFLLLCLTSYILESPLKYALGKAHISQIIYGRDAFAAFVIVIAFASWMSGKTFTAAIPATFILVAHAFYGILIQGSLIQPFIGLKLYLTFLLGIACFATFRENQRLVVRWYIAMYVLTVIGVCINWATDMPWAGETFESAVGATEVSREWTTGGIRRLAGFAKASFDASTIVVTIGAALALIPGLSVWMQLALLLTSIGIVVLTTSKGSMLALVFIALYIGLRRRSENRLGVFFYVAPAAMLAIPLLLFAFEYKATVHGDLWFLLSSFAERINWMWPRAFGNLGSWQGAILGRGVGGIGFPQRFGEGLIYNSADNVMVYLFVSFGIAALIYVYITLKKLEVAAPSITPYIWGCLLSWLLYWIFYGFTTNLIENPLFSFFIGLVVGAAFTPPIKKFNAQQSAI